MKLRNKKTGEIGNLKPYNEDGRIWVWTDNVSKPEYRYNSLAELSEEWEDYEELKGYWYINEFGTPTEITHTRENIYDTQRKNFGNYFDTEEEAERAVEKLKAWKRLKDKGFSIDGYTNDIGDNYYMPSDFIIKLNYNGDHRKSYSDGVFKDLDLLFGGEE